MRTLAVCLLALVALLVTLVASAHDPHPCDLDSGECQPVPELEPLEEGEPCFAECQQALATAHCPPLPVWRGDELLVIAYAPQLGRCPYITN